MKGIQQFAANLLSYIPIPNVNKVCQHLNNLVIARTKRVNFFETQ